MVSLHKELDGKPCHLYLDLNAPHIDYTSVSTIKGKYQKPFNPLQALASSKNEKSKWYGMEVKDIELAWKVKADKGKAEGDFVHNTVEDYLVKEGAYHFMTDAQQHICNQFKTYEENYRIREATILSEYCLSMDICNKEGTLTPNMIMRMQKSKLISLLVQRKENGLDVPYEIAVLKGMDVGTVRLVAVKYLIDRGLAGTADIIIRYLDRFMIWDIKTDNMIEKYSYFGGKMLAPIAHLDNCNFETYSLQIWIYALMAEKEFGIPFVGGKILHWDKKKLTFSIDNIVDRRKEAREVLMHFYGIGNYKNVAA